MGGKGNLQLLHTHDPVAGAPCGRETCIPWCNSDKEKDCDKQGILQETFSTTCRDLATC